MKRLFLLCLLLLVIVPAYLGASRASACQTTNGTQSASPNDKWIFVTTGDLNFARALHTATLLNNDKVLVVGGYRDDSGVVDSAELYDPNTGTWTCAGSLSSTHYGHTATLLNNGKVLVTGGWSVSDGVLACVHLYDPTTGTWNDTGSLGHGRYAHAATLLMNGTVLIAGGLGSARGGMLSSAELGEHLLVFLPFIQR